jgi:hypothetical protein
MAIIRKLNKITLEQESRHSEVDAAYSIVQGEDGRKQLQNRYLRIRVPQDTSQEESINAICSGSARTTTTNSIRRTLADRHSPIAPNNSYNLPIPRREHYHEIMRRGSPVFGKRFVQHCEREE